MLQDYRYGALHVVQDVKDRSQITRQLKEIDPNLFLELQLTPGGEHVWCVVEVCGGDQPPVTVYEARGPDGSPLPYPTETIVENFRRRSQENLTWRDRLEIADRRNNELKARRKETMMEQAEEIRRDFTRLAKTAPMLPRAKTPKQLAQRTRAQHARDHEKKMGLR